ncbi:sugar transferase [Homoserinimonas hongtaonis]|uniref:Sugar transferase n=1 Tax=Homoserinimonas hongtaonis TaxID=2079791 RepID=A0A2U1T130_9MICO|nr:sugar transferase [Salinibacterium hongtaonis]AWB90112.1 polyprenyl glycosylphosphotransferase [Salinibacterium hongtaonis]PWB97566.1 sugar transferase [Salinibacterium hongtaonis]
MTHSGTSLPRLSSPTNRRDRAHRSLHLVENDPARPVSTTSGRFWARQYRHRLRVTDSAIVAGVVAAAFALSTLDSPPVTGSLVGHGLIAVAAATLWLILLSAFRTREYRVLSVGITEYTRLVNACTTTFGILAICCIIAQSGPISWYFISAFPLGLVSLVVSRWLWRKWLSHQGRLGHSLSRVIVVGRKADVDYVIRQFSSASRAAYAVVGAVVDGGATSIAAVPTHHDLDQVAAMAAHLGADAVVVAGTPSGRADFIRTLSWQLEGTATELILATNLANIAGPRIHLRPMEGLPLIHVEIPQFDGAKHVLKRAFDVVVAATALVALLPVLAVIAAAVRLDSAGPAFFTQERVGRDGRLFTMWKFRTMTQEAPEALEPLLNQNESGGVLFKMRNDPRVTRIGRVLRRHSLDELPQLWNIITGDMSLVGPRPPLAREVEQYEDHVHRRLYIRPGLTGMWQINGRSDLSWEQSVQLDLYYVENWSLVGDIVIMWRTVRQVSHPVGAY